MACNEERLRNTNAWELVPCLPPAPFIPTKHESKKASAKASSNGHALRSCGILVSLRCASSAFLHVITGEPRSIETWHGAPFDSALLGFGLATSFTSLSATSTRAAVAGAI